VHDVQRRFRATCDLGSEWDSIKDDYVDSDDRLIAYLQGRLDEAERAAFEREMRSDPTLAAEAAALRGARERFAQEERSAEARRGAAWERFQGALPIRTPSAANDDRPFRLSLAQAAAVVVLAIGLWQFAVAPMLTGDQAAFVTVSDDAEGPTLQVVFRPDASLGEVSALLREIGGDVSSGPGALGVWRLEFEDADALDAAAQVLANRPGLVETVLSP